MMILAIALAVQSMVPAASPPKAEVQQDILVIGTKLKTWKGRVRSRRGQTQCITQKSSGDRDIDAIGCSAMTVCWAPLQPRIVASVDKRRPAEDRRALNAAVTRELTACVTARRDALIAALAEARFQSRRGSLNAQD